MRPRLAKNSRSCHPNGLLADKNDPTLEHVQTAAGPTGGGEALNTSVRRFIISPGGLIVSSIPGCLQAASLSCLDGEGSRESRRKRQACHAPVTGVRSAPCSPPYSALTTLVMRQQSSQDVENTSATRSDSTTSARV